MKKKKDGTLVFKRTEEEEKRLLDLYLKKNVVRCYYCDVEIDVDKDDCSTEFAIFWACGKCYPKYGNPDEN